MKKVFNESTNGKSDAVGWKENSNQVSIIQHLFLLIR